MKQKTKKPRREWTLLLGPTGYVREVWVTELSARIQMRPDDTAVRVVEVLPPQRKKAKW